MKRPVGVILTCVVLGLASCLFLLIALVYGALPWLSASVPTTAGTNVDFHKLLPLFLGLALFFVLLAAWAIVTLVGLAGLKNWARWSTLIIGGLLATIGSVTVMFSSIFFANGRLPGTAPGAPAGLMQAVMAFIVILYGGMGAIGVWWLVYFNLRSVKAAFVPQMLYQPLHSIYGSQASIAPGDLNQLVTRAGVAAAPPRYLPPARRSPPAGIVIIACLLLLGVLSIAVVFFLPLPLMIFGEVITGPAARGGYLLFGLFSALLGIGLLRLDDRARVGTMLLIGFGVVNLLATLRPSYQAKLALFSDSIAQKMHIDGMPPSPPVVTPPGFIYGSILIGFVIYGLMLWVLMRHRSDFRKGSVS